MRVSAIVLPILWPALSPTFPFQSREPTFPELEAELLWRQPCPSTPTSHESRAQLFPLLNTYLIFTFAFIFSPKFEWKNYHRHDLFASDFPISQPSSTFLGGRDCDPSCHLRMVQVHASERGIPVAFWVFPTYTPPCLCYFLP